jgi:cysteine-rich repeat protein
MRLLYLTVWVVTMIAGCVSTNTLRCDDGTTCPAGYTCGDAGGCFSPSEVSACREREEGAECQTPDGRGFCVGGGCATVVCGNAIVELGEACDDGNSSSADGCNGTCTSDESCGNGIIELAEQCDPPGPACSETCAAIFCGNGIVDPGEVCDDGNLTPLDGCYFDCMSDETCGNGIVDFAMSEQCDDANAVAFDGCGQCLLEPFDWNTLPQAPPAAREGSATTYDVARGRIVMFGGRTAPGPNGISGETWESNGTLWTKREPLRSPPARTDAMMTYDSTRHRVILFGGNRGLSVYSDTWEYDGVTWTRIDASTHPPPRSMGVLAYDPVRDRVVLYGGFAGGVLADTWELDGTTWTQRTLSPNPGPLFNAAATFDPKRGVIVLYGGHVNGTTATAAVWELDAAGWTSRGDAPEARWGHALVFDAAAGKVVSVAGVTWTIVTNTETSDVVDFDGIATWTTRGVTGTAPAARLGSAVAYDVAHDRMVIFGGRTLELTSFSDGFAVTSADTWISLAAPAPQLEHPVLYDDLRRGRVRSFGGLVDGNEVTNNTFELDGDGWITVDDPPDADSAYPTPRREHGLAYDSARGVLVVFGGRGAGAGTFFGDTWEFDGATWTKDTDPQPSARFQVAMAYDARRAVVVMFGGVIAGVQTDETWEYDGTWTLRTPATKPPADATHVLAYDGRRGVTVLVTTTGATWEWDGTTWTPIATPVSAEPRARAALAFHADRGTMFLTAGMPTSAIGGGYSDTWEYDGTTWTPAITSLAPSERSAHGMAYSTVRHALIVAGGVGTIGPLDTWELRYAPRRGTETCETTMDYDHDGAAGCADAECWTVCTPTCSIGAPAAQCQQAPRCGDGACTAVEDCHTCASDCTCTPLCGDGYCDPPETATTCPGDC